MMFKSQLKETNALVYYYYGLISSAVPEKAAEFVSVEVSFCVLKWKISVQLKVSFSFDSVLENKMK